MKIIFIIAFLFLGLFLFNIYLEEERFNRRYNNWAEECIKQGGIVTVSEKWIGGQHYACIKHGKEILRVDY